LVESMRRSEAGRNHEGHDPSRVRLSGCPYRTKTEKNDDQGIEKRR
jgi:hypothetical protein